MNQEALTLSEPIAQRKPARRGRRAKQILLGVVLFLMSVLLLLWYIGVFGGNVREVEPGRVYRSAQLTGRTLDEVLDARRIRTMLSLRGGSPEDGWYRSETASCAKRNIRHITLSFSAVRMPPPSELKKLLAVFDTAQYPLLFHCRGGADRSGLAGVLYLHLYKHVPLDEAQAQQLTWRYGHIRWGQARPMSDFFDLYRNTGQGMGLRAWIEQKYPALYEQLPAHLKGAGYDLAPAAPASQPASRRHDAHAPKRVANLGLHSLRHRRSAHAGLGARA
jgi:protein tyrosine phosphatase (PTP) superfamily phosphohydrolase (DUF442 family)